VQGGLFAGLALVLLVLHLTARDQTLGP